MLNMETEQRMLVPVRSNQERPFIATLAMLARRCIDWIRGRRRVAHDSSHHEELAPVSTRRTVYRMPDAWSLGQGSFKR